MLRASTIRSYDSDVDFFHLLINQIPVLKSLLVVYMKPRWGEHRLTNPWSLDFNDSRWGRAARVITPPME